MGNVQVKGKIFEGEYIGRCYKKGTVFQYRIYIPDSGKSDEYALLVNHDGLNMSEVQAMDALFATGDVPNCIIVGISGGTLFSTVKNARDRAMRMNNYDLFTPEYPNFLVNEFLPYIEKKYCVKISTSADLHAVSGGSSGGVSAWNIAWHRNDYFRRVYMSSPSFLSMGKGEELPVLIRKHETKPIRVYMEYSEKEPDDYFGSSYCAAMEAERALRFAGYEMQCEYYLGEGHCSRYWNVEALCKAMKWLWKDFDSQPIRVNKLSPRVEKIVYVGEDWEETENAFPIKVEVRSNGEFTAAGKYFFRGGEVFFQNERGEKKLVAKGFGKISSLAFSSDKWRLYIGDKERGCVYAMRINKDGSLEGKYVHAALHLATDFEISGALDICVDSTDRVYVATEIGIQTIRSFGLIDVILSLPRAQKPERIEIGEDGNYLYVLFENKVFKRKLKQGSRGYNTFMSMPLCNDYYD